jgi:hypothetical protein
MACVLNIHVETQGALGWTWKFSFWTIGGIKTLKFEDIAYNVEKQKNYIGDIVGIRVQNVLYFIFGN